MSDKIKFTAPKVKHEEVRIDFTLRMLGKEFNAFFFCLPSVIRKQDIDRLTSDDCQPLYFLNMCMSHDLTIEGEIYPIRYMARRVWRDMAQEVVRYIGQKELSEGEKVTGR